MPLFGLQDLRSLCRDTGVPVSFNGVARYTDTGEPILGLFDRPIQSKLSESGYGGAVVAMPSVALPANAFSPMPRPRDILIVDGTAYSVSTPTAEDDGAMLRYDLSLAGWAA